MMQESQLVHYDAAVRELAQAHQIDEVKDLRDKAMALEAYMRQAMNTEMERKALDIRLRAERKCGQLLKEQAESGERATRASGVDRGANKHLSHDTTSAPTLSELGISRDQSSKWQKLAEIPEDEFERALQDKDQKPSTNSLMTKASGRGGTMDRRALWLWGRLRDIEKDYSNHSKLRFLWGELTESMQEDVRRMLPIAMDLFSHLEGIANEQRNH